MMSSTQNPRRSKKIHIDHPQRKYNVNMKNPCSNLNFICSENLENKCPIMYSQLSHYFPSESGYKYIKNTAQSVLSEIRCSATYENRCSASKRSKSSPIKLRPASQEMTSLKNRNTNEESMTSPKIKYISSFPVKRRRSPLAAKYLSSLRLTQPAATQTDSPARNRNTNTILPSLLLLLLPLLTSDQSETPRKTRWNGLDLDRDHSLLFFIYNFFLSYYHILYNNIYLFRISNHLFL